MIRCLLSFVGVCGCMLLLDVSCLLFVVVCCLLFVVCRLRLNMFGVCCLLFVDV